MKHAREFKGKPNWKAVVMQSALCGEVGAIYRAAQTSEGVQAFDDKAAIECADRRNYEGLKLMLPHLTPKHYINVLYHCAAHGYLKELKLCLNQADANAVVGATTRVARNNHNAALPIMVEHLKKHSYSRDQRARIIEGVASSGNEKALTALLKLYPQNNTTVYFYAVLEGVYSENLNVLALFLPSIERFNSEQAAKALTYAAKYNGKAIPYLLTHATTPVFEHSQIRDIVHHDHISLDSVQHLAPYWGEQAIDEMCKSFQRKQLDTWYTPSETHLSVFEFLTNYRQKQTLLAHVDEQGTIRARKM